jgi:hypothetical protein
MEATHDIMTYGVSPIPFLNVLIKEAPERVQTAQVYEAAVTSPEKSGRNTKMLNILECSIF